MFAMMLTMQNVFAACGTYPNCGAGCNNNFVCIPCDPGNYCDNNTNPCPIGSRSPAEQSACTICDSGPSPTANRTTENTGTSSVTGNCIQCTNKTNVAAYHSYTWADLIASPQTRGPCDIDTCDDGYVISGSSCTVGSWTVTLDKNGGSGTVTVDGADATGTADWTGSLTYGTNYTATSMLTKSGGYTFHGWDTSSTCDDGTATITAGTSDGKIYYACWKACDACAPASATGGASCTLSVVGNSCTYATTCGAGKRIIDNGEPDASCTNCEAGTYRSQTSHSEPECELCTIPAEALFDDGFTGRTSDNCPWTLSCGAGSCWNGNMCVSCANGTYTSSATTVNGAGATNPAATACSSCGNKPANADYIGPGTSASNCPWRQTCGSGKRWGGTDCVDCVAGTAGSVGSVTSSNGAAVSANNCPNCGAGKFSAAAGALNCTDCAKGSISAGTNNTGCTECTPTGSTGANGTTSGIGQSSCVGCGVTDVSTWETPTWTNNSVANECTIATCIPGYLPNAARKACDIQTYAITYNPNGGTIPTTPYPTTCQATQTITNLPIPTWTGRVFIGWFNEVGEKIEQILPGDCVSDIALIANWECNPYSYGVGCTPCPSGTTTAGTPATNIENCHITATAKFVDTNCTGAPGCKRELKFWQFFGSSPSAVGKAESTPANVCFYNPPPP